MKREGEEDREEYRIEGETGRREANRGVKRLLGKFCVWDTFFFFFSLFFCFVLEFPFFIFLKEKKLK